MKQVAQTVDYGIDALIAHRRSLAVIGVLFAILAVFATQSVVAGTGGAEFADLEAWVAGLIEGNLGRLIAMIGLVIGGIAGAAKLSGTPMLNAFLIAIVFAFAIGVIGNILGAQIA